MRIITVMPGDTVLALARRYGVPADTIISDNGILPPFELVEGQAILLPGDEEPRWPAVVHSYAYPGTEPSILAEGLSSLSSLGIFSTGFTLDGDILMPQDTALLAACEQVGAAPVLVLTSLGEDGRFSTERATRLFRDERLAETVLEKLREIAVTRGYRLLEADFEFVAGEDREAYLAFLQRAKSVMADAGIGLQADLAPKTSSSQSGLLYEGQDYRQIGEIADRVLVMSYEWGYTYGPPMAVAPLDKVRQVMTYAVSEIPPEKILMGVPNYGYDWPLPYIRGETAAETLGNQQAVRRAWEVRSDVLFDQPGQSPYYYYTDGLGVSHAVWFEDARSWDAKLRLAQELGVAGIGIWNMIRSNPQGWAVVKRRIKTE